MLTTVKAYSSWQYVDRLLLTDDGRAETDLIQILDITGLEPVDAAINTIPFGSLDGDSYVGSSVGRRNIVMTVKPNPNWVDWTYEKLRRILYTYFMPKRLVRLVFETDEIAPVEISGYVESIEPAIFSKDGEIQISVICPYPYFTAVDATVVNGEVNTPIEIEYDGSIETGMGISIVYASGTAASWVVVQLLGRSNFFVVASIDADNYFVMDSVPGSKFVYTVNVPTSVITNVLSKVQPGSVWPVINPGHNDFSIITNTGIQYWQIQYLKRYGGL